MKNYVYCVLVVVLIASLAGCAPSSGIDQTANVTSTATSEGVAISAEPQPEETAAAPSGGRTPPQEAVDACAALADQEDCQFTDRNGSHTGVCENIQGQLACSPNDNSGNADQSSDPAQPQAGEQSGDAGAGYNIEQAISDRAQLSTIAFDALAFLTGDLGADSFFPPGKVADFWGFQYLRDNDPSQMGHSGEFLTRAALNVLYVLTPDQRAQLVALAEDQVDTIEEYAYDRFVLMDAFRRLLEGDLPAGTTGLNEEAVMEYSAQLYVLDGRMSYERAQVLGGLINALNTSQRAYLDDMVGAGMLDWPVVQEPSDLNGLDQNVHVAVMTYAADLFSWYAGSVESDVYFCPERHGTYFGSFYLKDMPAMGNPNYSISTTLTGDMGDAFMGVLNSEQAQMITSLVEIQREYLLGIVETREQVSNELRRFMEGENADQAAVLALMQQYGELDGEIIYNFAVHFSSINASLSDEQRAQLTALREEMLGDLMYPSGAFLYSQPIPMPDIPNSDFLFQ